MCKNRRGKSNARGHVHRNYTAVSLIQRIIKMPGIGSDAGRTRFWLMQLALLCFLLMLCMQLVKAFMVKEDTEKMFECVSIFSFTVMGALKLKNLRTNFQQWSFLLLQLDNLEVKELDGEKPDVDYESDDEDTEKCLKTHIDTYTKKIRALKMKVIRVYTLTLIIFIFSPFVEFLYWKLQSEDVKGFPHILPCWSPLDTISLFGYLITIAVEIVASLYAVLLHLAFDLTVLGVIIFLSGQFSLLCDLTRDIAGNGKYYDVTARRDARAHLRLKRCHYILVTLEKSVFELDKLIQQVMGIYFLTFTLTLCSVAIRLSSEKMTVMELLSLLQYTGASLIQMFLFCYFGDILLHTSSVGMGEGVFASAWWRLSPHVRREVLLMGIGQARVRRLRAGPFNTLDLPSFIQIVRTAYSYYAVLQKQT